MLMRVTCGAVLVAAAMVDVPTAGAQGAPAAVAPAVVGAMPGVPQPPATAPTAPVAPVPATETPAGWPRANDRSTDARFKVRVMEGVLERAVEHAARTMNQQLRTVSPDLVLLTGAARARGYRLDGYGLFFDVQVPAALRQSMGWTVRMMRQNNESIDQALTLFKRMAASLEGKARADAEMAVRNIELQVRPPVMSEANGGLTGPSLFSETRSASPAAVGVNTSQSAHSVEAASTARVEPPTPGDASATGAVVQSAPEPAPSAPAINPLLIQNPDLAYELEVREALISAMLDWGVTLPLQAGEWLTVAARDNQDVVIPGEAADVVTIIMRVRGSDLAEFRAGRLPAADIRKRVEVREF